MCVWLVALSEKVWVHDESETQGELRVEGGGGNDKAILSSALCINSQVTNLNFKSRAGSKDMAMCSPASYKYSHTHDQHSLPED